ncbi:MAG: hypothetical protein ACI81R_000912 [Bradymonadia bacterium]|jgi:hypothetical protein
MPGTNSASGGSKSRVASNPGACTSRCRTSSGKPRTSSGGVEAQVCTPRMSCGWAVWRARSVWRSVSAPRLIWAASRTGSSSHSSVSEGISCCIAATAWTHESGVSGCCPNRTPSAAIVRGPMSCAFAAACAAPNGLSALQPDAGEPDASESRRRSGPAKSVASGSTHSIAVETLGNGTPSGQPSRL